MRNTIRHGFMLLGCAVAALAWKGISGDLVLAPTSRLWIDGTSNVRSFTCTSTSLNAAIDAPGADAAHAVLGGSKAVEHVQFTVAEKSLDCGNGTMNDHMRHALNASAHPDIAFRLDSYDLAPADSGETGTLQGVLNINGTDKAITLPVKLSAGSAGELHVTGRYELDMKDYGVKPPTLFFGTLRVGEKVTVNFDLLLQS
jgi:polyisoprenoid-binding protein YceI